MEVDQIIKYSPSLSSIVYRHGYRVPRFSLSRQQTGFVVQLINHSYFILNQRQVFIPKLLFGWLI